MLEGRPIDTAFMLAPEVLATAPGCFAITRSS